MKARDRVYEDLGEGTWNLEVIGIFKFSNIYSMYDTGERSEPEKNIIIR